MKRTKVIRILVAVLVVLQVAVCASCGLFPEEEELAVPSLKTPRPVQYNYFAVEETSLVKGASGVGTVTSIYYYRHSFSTSGGTIKSFNVTLGDVVSKGDILVETDNSSIELQYLQAQIDYEQARERFNTQTAQYNNGSITDIQYRIYELQYRVVETTYQNLRNSFENTQLIAQVDGTVVYINTEYSTNTSKSVVAGETMIAIDSGDEQYRYLVFDKTQEAITNENAVPQQFRIGTELTLNLIPSDEDPNPIQFTGVIVGTDQIIKDTGIGYVDTAKYYCKITSFPNYGENPTRQISSGTLINYTYVEESRESCLQIPVTAYYSYNGKTYVYMLDRETNLRKEVYIELGIANASRIEVISGLSRGDRIIVS